MTYKNNKTGVIFTGEMVSVDKKTFEFQNGKLNNYLDETIYVGSFYKNKYEGDGEFYYKDKIIFRGLFQDNFYKKGLYYDYPNQRIIDGVWKNKIKLLPKEPLLILKVKI